MEKKTMFTSLQGNRVYNVIGVPQYINTQSKKVFQNPLVSGGPGVKFI